MKTTVVKARQFALTLLLLGAVSGLANAQKGEKKSEKSGEVSVKIIERTGDEVREIERTYQNLSEADRDEVVKKLVDSIKVAHKDNRKRQMTIIIEDNDGREFKVKRPKNEALGQNPRYYYRYKSSPDAWVFGNGDWQRDLNRGMDSLSDRLSRFQFQFPKDFDAHIIRPFDEWSRNFNPKVKASSIRSLEVFPNNPDRDQLNIRFTAPAKGNVAIIVTSPSGKEVARKEVKDFSGEYVGQIELGKKAQGVYFVTVTQNEDGAVRRVVVE